MSGPRSAPRVAPRVTVVTPVWNAAATLPAAIASVRAQSMPDWEMILVDDGSTDQGRAIAEAQARADPRLRVLGWADNRGPARARNAAIRAARGRHIAFLDADDRWLPDKLARQLAFMAETGAALAFSAYRQVDAAGRDLGTVPVPARVTRADLLKGNVIGCLTAIYDTHAFGRAEMPDLPRRQDYALWLALLARVPAAHGQPEVLAEYRVGPGSLSADKLVAARATWRVLRGPGGLGRARAGYHFLHYAARGLARRL